MNGYELSRAWFDFCFDNPDQISTNHTALFFFIIEHNNRLGWKEKFGLPSQMAMDAIGIKNWRTYKKAFEDLVNWKFIKVIELSKNQYSATVIAIVKNTKAPTKALSKAIQKHSQKQYISIVGIDKPNNLKTIKPDNEEGKNSSPPPLFSDEQLQKNQSAFSPAAAVDGFPQFGDIAPGDMLLHSEVAKCLEIYFSAHYLTTTRETLAMRHFIDENILRDWADCFNVYLLKSGKPKKTLQDWATHFSNWLPKQDLSKNPKKIHDYEQPPDKKATGGLNSDYKRKLAERMAANSSKG